MKYRELGNTGLKVSEIGMGCEGFAEDRCRMTRKSFLTQPRHPLRAYPSGSGDGTGGRPFDGTIPDEPRL